MIEYDGTKCESHGITRCVICMALAAKGKKAKPSIPVAPPEITDGPPANIEGLSENVRDRADGPAPENLTPEWESTVEEPTRPRQNISNGPHPGPEPDGFSRETFQTLPVDDSHASKVVRAAAEFASASKAWAEQIAYTEKIRQELLKAELSLDNAAKAKDQAEAALKGLVNA